MSAFHENTPTQKPQALKKQKERIRPDKTQPLPEMCFVGDAQCFTAGRGAEGEGVNVFVI